MSRRHRKHYVWIVGKIIHYILLGIYKISYGIYIRRRYRVRLTEDSDQHIKGPYLLLSNHCNNYDGVFLQTILGKPIKFVITDSVFKIRALGGIMSLIGYIPKKKFVSDIKAIKKIMRTAKDGGIIGIFPEGRRSWDGKTVHISEATYKLIRMLKVPVVTAKIMGAYLSEPRWANTKRRGMIEIEMKTLIRAEELAHLSLKDIQDKITAALDHDELAWQQQKKIAFKGKSLAEGLENLLFMCPECKQVGTMHSKDDRVWCSACNAQYLIDQYGFIHSESGFLPSDSISDLNEWQRNRLKKSLARIKANEIYLQDEDAYLEATESVRQPYQDLDSGNLQLTRLQLKVGSTTFNLSDVYGISVSFKSHLFFRHKSKDYRISFKNKRVSVYKWYSALKFVTGDMKEAF